MVAKFVNLSNYFLRHHLKFFAMFVYYIIRVIFSCDIPPTVRLGKGGRFPHSALGVVIDRRVVIGDNYKIYQNVTLGYRNGLGPPRIGDNVLIGVGAVIIGKISIGNNVSIGANAVVLSNVPDNSVAIGVPAIIKKKAGE
jgi:serine O-acetyltransferase